jgi:hypothetical protein
MRRHGIIATSAGFFFALMAATANAQPYGTYLYASPTGTNDECSRERPYTAQAAANTCQEKSRDMCTVHLADGVYVDPAIDIHYYRGITIKGNCEAPQNVVLRATKPGALISIQDHTIGILGCLTLEATVPGTAGLLGRQHVIIDYDRMIFGPMSGGTHIALTEFSIASCGSASITGDANCACFCYILFQAQPKLQNGATTTAEIRLLRHCIFMVCHRRRSHKFHGARCYGEQGYSLQ